KLSSKKLGSRNRAKQRIEVAKLYRKIREQRADFNHKLSRQLVNDYDLIVFEKLQITNMLGNHRLAKSISDASWSQLQNFTAYKAENAGKRVEFVAPQGTTKECSRCGNSMQLSLKDRVFNCACCGLVLDRDQNAAINILSRSRIRQELPDVKPVGEFSRENSMNQEATVLVRW
ncbi:MAG: transposase, partial [Candidatus Omnitrophota bacterium]